MWFNFLFIFLEQNIQTSGQYENCDSMKVFIIKCLLWNGNILTILDRADIFWPAFLQISVKCILKLRCLSTVTPKSFSALLSHIISSPTFTHKCSFVPHVRKWHFPWFSFIKLLSNHKITDSVSSSKLCNSFSSLLILPAVWCHPQSWVMVAKVVPPVPSVTQNLDLHKKSSNNDNQLVKVSYFLNQMSAPTF